MGDKKSKKDRDKSQKQEAAKQGQKHPAKGGQESSGETVVLELSLKKVGRRALVG